MSAMGQKRTSRAIAIYVRFWGQSGLSVESLRMSAYSQKGTLKACANALKVVRGLVLRDPGATTTLSVAFLAASPGHTQVGEVSMEIASGGEPVEGVSYRFLGRTRAIAQLPLCFDAAEEHRLACHSHAVHSNEWLAAKQTGPSFG